MGTNYYLQGDPCKECKHVENKKHIGKSSGGWEFHFRGYSDESIVSVEDWEDEINDEKKIIIDEYGRVLDKKEFFENVRASKEIHHLINLYNVTYGKPQTEREKKYCETRHNQNGYIVERACWKDNSGYTFTDREFS